MILLIVASFRCEQGFEIIDSKIPLRKLNFSEKFAIEKKLVVHLFPKHWVQRLFK